MEQSSDSPDLNKSSNEVSVVGGPEGQNNTDLPPAPSSPKLRNWLIAFVLVLLLGVGAWAVLRLTDDPENNQPTEVVKNEIPLIRMSVQEGPINLFYYGVTNDSAQMINNYMYEGLVTYESINKIVPNLATSWTNTDDKTWIFKLKENVPFHNGKMLSAQQVKASLDEAKEIGQGGLGIDLASVEVVDPLTVKVVTKAPDPLLLGRLAFISIGDHSTVKTDKVPAGTGPYRIKPESKPNANNVELTAFDNYHGGTVYTKALSVRVLSIADIVEEFNKGNLDIAQTLVSGSNDITLPNIQRVTIKDFTVTFLGMNGADGSPLTKLKVRQAIELAVDPDAVITANKVIGEVASQFVTADIPGYNTELTRPSVNVEQAKKLLTEAGYPDGFTIKLTYASSNNDGMFNSVKEQLAKIGITVENDGYGDDTEGFFNVVINGQAEFFFLAYSPTVLDASDTYNFLFGQSGNNLIHYQNNTVNDLLDKASTTLNESQRLELLEQVGTELQTDVASLPLYSRDSITVLAKPYAVERHLPNGASGFKFNEVYLP